MTTYTFTVQASVDGVTAPLQIHAESMNEVRNVVSLLKEHGMLHPEGTRQPTPHTDEPPACPVHHSKMRKGKNGGFYCPRKTEDGEYCKERA